MCLVYYLFIVLKFLLVSYISPTTRHEHLFFTVCFITRRWASFFNKRNYLNIPSHTSVYRCFQLILYYWLLVGVRSQVWASEQSRVGSFCLSSSPSKLRRVAPDQATPVFDRFFYNVRSLRHAVQYPPSPATSTIPSRSAGNCGLMTFYLSLTTYLPSPSYLRGSASPVHTKTPHRMRMYCVYMYVPLE